MPQDVISVLENKLQEWKRQVVFVCGLGGVGKTEFCSNLQASLGKEAIIIRNDWYLIFSSPERRKRINHAFDSEQANLIEQEANPQNWYDWNKLASDLKALRNRGALHVSNVWNQKTGEKDLNIDFNVGSDAVIICDGIYLLDPSARSLADVTVLLEASSEIARSRAGKRDGHRSETAYLRLKDKLMQKYDIPYFDTYRNAADIIINNEDFEHPIVIKP